MKYLLKIGLIVLLLLPFMPDEASQNNRLIIRDSGDKALNNYITDRHLKSPMPWEK